MSLFSYRKSIVATRLIVAAFLLSGCGATTKVGVPDSYDGKLVKLMIAQKPALPLVELEVLAVNGEAVDNPSSLQLVPGKHEIKSRCKVLKGVITNTTTHTLKPGRKLKLQAIESRDGNGCITMLVQF